MDSKELLKGSRRNEVWYCPPFGKLSTRNGVRAC